MNNKNISLFKNNLKINKNIVKNNPKINSKNFNKIKKLSSIYTTKGRNNF